MSSRLCRGSRRYENESRLGLAIKLTAGLFMALSFSGCDKEVAGVTFESGFMVDPDTAYDEGWDAGQNACRSDQIQFVKYKSGTEAASNWRRGYGDAQAANCPNKS
jgi:hypothetical protein